MHKNIYFETVSHIERLHRLFLELIHVELSKLEIYNINNVQSLILYHIGRGSKTIQELTQDGYYLGSNMAYNIRKMLESGYLIEEHQEDSDHTPNEGHPPRFKLSQEGLALYKKLDHIFLEQANELEKKGIPQRDVQDTSTILHRIEDFWKSHAVTNI